MTKEQFDHEILYQASISPFRRMLESKIISEKEFAVIDTILRRKYGFRSFTATRQRGCHAAFTCFTD